MLAAEQNNDKDDDFNADGMFDFPEDFEDFLETDESEEAYEYAFETSPAEPVPLQRAPIYQFRFFGRSVLDLSRLLGLPERQDDPVEIGQRVRQEQERELAARKDAGLSPFLPQRQVFSDCFARKDPQAGDSKGVSNAEAAAMIKDLADGAYFIIAADAWWDEDRNRHAARLVFSNKEEDRRLAINGEAELVKRALQHLKDNVWEYAHLHDRRRYHPVSGEPIGNCSVDFCGRMRDKQGAFWRLRLLPDGSFRAERIKVRQGIETCTEVLTSVCGKKTKVETT